MMCPTLQRSRSRRVMPATNAQRKAKHRDAGFHPLPSVHSQEFAGLTMSQISSKQLSSSSLSCPSDAAVDRAEEGRARCAGYISETANRARETYRACQGQRA